ncbi:MAG: HEAT repeat domain-containing protein [Spirochaetales bacterium]|jgi:HEAT repeat protein|nr:HEAT repeat domain-containing protein [Exilispira sp.]NMC66944.1 HEAT repeat domain-containing protein [Spirochaetales bacterium]
MRKNFILIIFCILFLSSIIFAQGTTNDPYTAQQPDQITLEELFLGLQNIPIEYFEQMIIASNNHDALMMIVSILSQNNDPQSISMLIRLIDPNYVQMVNGTVINDWWDVKVEAIIALGKMKAKDAVPVLIKILQTSNDPIVKAYAAMALGQIGDKSAVDALLIQIQIVMASWKSDNLPLLYGLIVGLGDLGDPKAIPILLQISQGPYPAFIRQVAVASLKKVSTSK